MYVLIDPLSVSCDFGIDTWILRQSTSGSTPGDDTGLPSTNEKWTTRVTVAHVLQTSWVSCTNLTLGYTAEFLVGLFATRSGHDRNAQRL